MTTTGFAGGCVFSAFYTASVIERPLGPLDWSLWSARRIRPIAQWKIDNWKLKIMVSALPTILIHFRRKYHNFQFYIFNCQFGQLPAKLQVSLHKGVDILFHCDIILLHHTSTLKRWIGEITMRHWHNESTKQLCAALLSLETPEECWLKCMHSW